VEKAEIDASTPEGEHYAELARAHYERLYKPVLERCIAAHDPARIPSFALVVTIAHDGTVHGIAVHPTTAEAACLLKSLVNAVFPAPPAAVFHLHIVEAFGR
jgi:hypothetical protein